MTTPDVPAGRGRDELREKLRHLTRDPGPLGSAVCALLKAAEADVPVMVMPDESRAILALFAPQEAPAEGISLSAQLSQAAAWMRVWDECQRLGMDTYGAPSTRTGLDIVLDFIRGHAAPQGAREGGARCGMSWSDTFGTYRCGLPLHHDGPHIREDAVAARPAPETREPELLGYVVERQLTTGEWMRVWRGRTMWFDHDEAVLDRDAYALDGIPAHIRPVYLGAPAPAEARQVLALDAIRDVLGIDYDEDSAMWYLPAEPAPIECATLDDALRAYAKMAAPASGEPSGAEAVVREAYAVIDELAPQWSGSSIASVLRAYLERMAVPYPWRPIETAPKDGSRVLLAGCGENGGWVCVASWRGGRWRDGDYSIEPPTHWMPLPHVPTAPGAPEEGAGES